MTVILNSMTNAWEQNLLFSHITNQWQQHLPDAKSSLQQRNDSWCKKQCSGNFTQANVVFIHAQSWSKKNWHCQSRNKHWYVMLQQKRQHRILIMWCHKNTAHAMKILSVCLSVCHMCIVSIQLNSKHIIKLVPLRNHFSLTYQAL